MRERVKRLLIPFLFGAVLLVPPATYTNVGPLSEDGKWPVTPGPTATYKTRILAYRPIDGQKFNGTVIVEWLNVSGGLDAGPDWVMGHTELIRQGFAWVGVSAQYVGVEGGISILGLPSMPLKTTDPERYASLNEWVRHGTPPPTAPRLEVSKWPLFPILRDEHGNALGGIRTPQVDVPIATLSGRPQGGSLFCLLFGSTVPFDDAKLASLYPDQESYVSAFNEATDRVVQQGFILPEDAKLMKAAAAASDIGS